MASRSQTSFGLGFRVAKPIIAWLKTLAWHDQHARGTLSVLASCVVHTALFIGLATIYIAAREETHSVVLQAALDGADDVSLEFAEVPNIEPPAAGELPSSLTPPEAKELDLNVNARLAQSQASVNATLTSALASASKQLTSSGGVGDSGGGAAGAGIGESLSKLGANFFGSYAQGERFVFVLDSSRSMAGDRWIYACQELMDSVNRLEPNQHFYVICFDDKTTCMFNSPASKAKFYQNDEATRLRLKRWLKSKRLGPGTLPATAMAMALKMHPDAIFLLSDGEIRDDTLFVLRQLNGFSTEQRQVPIHTVHLMSLEGRQTLQLIATENAGTFTPVQGGRSF